MVSYSSSKVAPLLFRTKADRLKSSLSVEAALAVPIYIFFIAFFLFIFRVIYAEEVITEALGVTAREVATLVSDDGVAERASMELVFRKNLEKPDFIEGLNLFSSTVEDEVIILRAGYKLSFPISFFGKKNFKMMNSVAERCFVGYDGNDDTNDRNKCEYVYITPTGNAYHKSPECNYLDLSIRKIGADSVKNVRNLTGRKYRKCSCVEAGQNEYYITDYGINYHGNIECKGLKRTVIKVKIDDVGERHPCNKCYGG